MLSCNVTDGEWEALWQGPSQLQGYMELLGIISSPWSSLWTPVSFLGTLCRTLCRITLTEKVQVKTVLLKRHWAEEYGKVKILIQQVWVRPKIMHFKEAPRWRECRWAGTSVQLTGLRASEHPWSGPFTRGAEFMPKAHRCSLLTEVGNEWILPQGEKYKMEYK